MLQHFWRVFGQCPTKLQYVLSFQPNKPTFRNLSLKIKLQSYEMHLCTSLSIVVLFVIITHWKKSKCPHITEWLTKLWYIHMVVYCKTIKNKKALWTNMKWFPGYTVLWKTQSSEKYMYYAILHVRKKRGIRKYMYISFVPKIKNAGRISQKLKTLVTYRKQVGKG